MSSSSSLLVIVVACLISVSCSSSNTFASDSSSPTSFSCGKIYNISCPFYLRGQQHNCQNFSYELSCHNNRTLLQLKDYEFYVEALNYEMSSIRMVDSGLADGNNICSSNSSLHPFSNLMFTSLGSSPKPIISPIQEFNTPITYIDCPAPVKSSARYIPAPPCSSSSSVSSYVVIGHMESSEVENNCKVQTATWVSCAWPNINQTSFLDTQESHDSFYGIELPFHYFYCLNCSIPGYFSEYCSAVQDENEIFSCDFSPCDYILRISFYCGIGLGARFLCGIALLSAFLRYKLRRRHLSVYDTIEDFLQGPNNLMPIRYTYSQIKNITAGFSDKLGAGAFGTVYKGKLRSGTVVAVKVLGNSNASDHDFINEVGSIGRIHHVNIVKLVGFCFDGKKRALIYEFMANGSLDKYILPGGGTDTLSCEKIYEISYQVACGIEYLHQGCDIQILHFDIKPHNILLDENFNPKISDFGLAKLRATDDSIVTMTAARGTLGYMAPELFYKNIGGVFGMLLMEMAGQRRNLNQSADQISQHYFPSRIYDQMSKGKEIEMEDSTEDERKLAKKMIIVAMWCIQMKPSERPSMNKVIEMLEGDSELLVMPLKSFMSPQEEPDQELPCMS
ncbi:rust resistance kinase Lr10-like [Apium graveolens]|uniref:rust resistance kinase Lr10-like n=1 Tax=Apium graveolens TaxID=4045 RepID=UPI003D7A581D